MQALNPIDPSTVVDSLAEMDFHSLAPFNAGHVGVFWSGAGGPSPWEMHPDCEEMLQVLEGAIEVEVLPLDGSTAIKSQVRAGSFIVIPKGCWHRQTMLQKTKELYLTPGQTEHSQAADPRTEN